MNSKKAITLLVLATLLMSIVPIIPVSAKIVTNPTFVELNSDVSWVASDPTYGDVVQLDSVGAAASTDYAIVRVDVDTSITLEDIGTNLPDFMYKLTTIDASNNLLALELYFESSGSGVIEATLLPYTSATKWDNTLTTWQKTTGHSAATNFAAYGDTDDGTAVSFDGSQDLTTVVAAIDALDATDDLADYELTRVGVQIGWVAVPTDMVALVDMIEVGGVTYELAVLGSAANFDIDYVTPGSVQYADTITVAGSGVTGGSEVSIYWDSVVVWDGKKGLLNTTEGNPDGTFECTIDVPSTLVGTHYLWAHDGYTGATTSYGPITVIPKLKISPSSGLPGETITLKGYGYGKEKTITLSDTGMGAVVFSPAVPETNDIGYFTATFKVPAGEPYDDANTLTASHTGATDDVAFKVGPSITLNTEEGPTGTKVEISGRGFTPTATIPAAGVVFDGVTCYLESTVTVKADGKFSLITYVPSRAKTGAYDFVITEQGAGTVSADAEFTIDGLAKVSATPEYGPQGSIITVEGWNFTQSAEDVVVTLEGAGSKTFETNSNGYFKGTYVVPAVASGPRTLLATQAPFSISDTQSFRAGIMIVILSPTSGPAGTKVALTGTGFTSADYWNATFGEDEWVDDTLSTLTEISANVYVPSVEPGVYTVSVLDIDADIVVEVEFEVTATTKITTDPVVAPAGYPITVEGENFAEDLAFMTTDFTDIELVYYNDTEEWTPTLTSTWTAGDDDWDDGYFEFTFTLAADDELGIGAYTMNVTDGTGMIAQLVFNVVEETSDIDPRKSQFALGEIVAFNVESSFPMTDSYIKVYDPQDNLYWRTDDFVAGDWFKVGDIQRILYADQVAGGNPMTLLDDAPLGEWFWQWYSSADAKLDNGTFTVVLPAADLIGEQVADLNNDIADLASQLTDVTSDFADVQSSIADVSALAADAVAAANAATEAVNAVASTANTASEAAANAATAAEAARDAASGLTTLVYGAIGAALVAALAAIVSLMQISRRIAG